jgi:ABC-2 type transport system permease protein
MTRSIVWRLVAKDLFFLRWFMLGAIAAGAGALVIMPQGRVPSYVAAVSLICTLIVLLIMLVMGPVVQERKDKIMLFILSLPVSTTEYVVAKVIANAIAFGVPWLVLTIATFLVVDLTPIPNGSLPFWAAVLGYIFFYYCALLAVGLLTDSGGWHATAITIGNISVNFLIPFLLARPSLQQNIEGPTAVWSSDLLWILALEPTVGIAVLGLALVARTRKPDFV